MKKIRILLAMLLMLTMLLSACATDSPAETPIGGGDAATEAGDTAEGDATAEGDKTMVVGMAEVAGSFNPYITAYGDNTIGQWQVFDPLVTKNENNELVGHLAESWEISEDNLTYTFKLRGDVTFSDGSAFTAEDAAYNIMFAKDQVISEWAMGGVESATAVDATTLEVKLSAVDVSFFEKLAWLSIVPKAAHETHGEEFGMTAETTIGSGPYIVESWVPGESATLVANPNYFLGEAAIKNVEMTSISDANAAVISLQTGELDLYIKDVPSISIPTLEAEEDVTVATFPSYVFMDIPLNNETGIFADPEVRQAVAYAVDREKMLQVGTEGQGVIVDYPGGPDYSANPNVENVFPAMDVEKAKQIIEEKGLVGYELVIKTQDTDPWPKLATALQYDLNSIGFNAQVEILDATGYGQEVWQNFNYELAISRYWSGTKEMAELMALVRSGDTMNFSKYVNDEVTALVDAAASTTDVAEREQLYTEAINLFTPEIPLIPLYYTYGSRAYNSELTITEGNQQHDRLYYYSWK